MARQQPDPAAEYKQQQAARPLPGQLAMEETTMTQSQVTWMCEQGHHGTTQRRWQSQGDDIWQGHCAGSTITLSGQESECPCSCHTA